MKNIITILIFAITIVSCGKQDTVYKPFVKEGGYIYPAKPINLRATSGYERILLEWDAPMDPSIRTTKLFWDNYTDSLSFTQTDYRDGSLQIWVDNLSDRSYTFDVVNYDAQGHKSLAAEITTTPFGESWLLSHAERSILSAKIDQEDAEVTMTKSTDEMVATQFRYKTLDGDVVESPWMLPEDNSIILPRAAKGKRFEFRSAYVPLNGVDTVWSVSWTRSPNPIVYALPRSEWTVTVTKDQEYSTFTCDKIFDGVSATNNRWNSARSGTAARVFPKVLSVDTGMADEPYIFTSFDFYQSPFSNTYRYIRNLSIYLGDQPYDPNDEDLTVHYGKPLIEALFSRSDEVSSVTPHPAFSGRYIAIVFTNSYSSGGYVDLWELVPYGYLASEVD